MRLFPELEVLSHFLNWHGDVKHRRLLFMHDSYVTPDSRWSLLAMGLNSEFARVMLPAAQAFPTSTSRTRK